MGKPRRGISLLLARFFLRPVVLSHLSLRQKICFFILCPARSTVIGSSAACAVAQLKSTESNCAMLDRMKKPELLITQKVGEVPVRGICSACPYSILVQSVVSAETMNAN